MARRVNLHELTVFPNGKHDDQADSTAQFPGLPQEALRLMPTAANRQPAFAAYSRTDADAPWAAHSIHVLSLEYNTISRLTLFVKPAGPRLFHAFGLPLTLTDAAKPEPLSTLHHS